ncbi:MAG TPA: head GIN domain-containing protein [Prolixibacteraceae bacterium]|nr:head GIN domain-containing protein [Prolixibacteraceae bacterium]
MKLNSIIFLLGVLLASLFSSCNPQGGRSENRFAGQAYTVESFDKISLTGGYDVEIKQTDEPGLVIKASEADYSKIDVWVENDVLYVNNKFKNITTDEIRLEISITKLSKIDIKGGVFLKTLGYVELDTLDMAVEGGANIKMYIKANQINVKTQGGVNVDLEGVAHEFSASTEGAGNIDADNLEAEIVTCKVAGIGNASIYATGELNAKIEGVGRISYRGNPNINKQINGIGIVHRK